MAVTNTKIGIFDLKIYYLATQIVSLHIYICRFVIYVDNTWVCEDTCVRCT
jgi:hypothetical protein